MDHKAEDDHGDLLLLLSDSTKNLLSFSPARKGVLAELPDRLTWKTAVWVVVSGSVSVITKFVLRR